MSASNEWTEYHLTPRGWETGSVKFDFNPVKVRERPSDAVLTLKYYEYMGSSFSRMDKGHEIVWRSSDEKRIAEFETKFGSVPPAEKLCAEQ